MTSRLDIIQNPKLRTLFAEGRKFIPHPTNALPSADDLTQQLKSCLHKYIVTVSTTTNLAANIFDAWLTHTITHINNQITTNLQNYKTPHTILTFNKHLQQQLKDLQQSLIITYVDKCSNDYAFMCPQLYNTFINDELNSTTYEKMTDTIDTIIQKHRKYSLIYPSNLT